MGWVPDPLFTPPHKLDCSLYVFTCIVADLFGIEIDFKPVIDLRVSVIGFRRGMSMRLSRQRTQLDSDYRNVCQTGDLPIFFILANTLNLINYSKKMRRVESC